ncbi:MAG TPA: ArsA-related P-loop ATPase [Anaeromyxobacteraceae bacterium]|nr:ArsA-related P-loop ATPase [Anaeromyxobacteraceae bacterium]
MAAVTGALASRRIAVCVGSGGVGKTTVAAAIALERALSGGRTLVCTIDPARRLANALGLAALGNVESAVPAERFAAAGLRPRGQLFAMMLDVKRTWDDLVARHAPSEAARDRILGNRLYEQMSSVLAGSQEYMAMEKLYELATDRDYDLVVLDTPPTAHALDFLEAPTRVLDFLENESARRLLAPAIGAGRVSLRLAQMSGGYLAKVLARFTGAQVLADLGQFLSSFHGMYEGFKRRAAAVRELLGRSEVGFVMVASPAEASIEEALAFHRRLRGEGMPVAGMVANRVTPDLWGEAAPLPSPGEIAAALGAGDGELGGRLAEALAEHQARARADARALDRLFAAEPGLPRAVVPRLEEDVHDLRGLARMAERI